MATDASRHEASDPATDPNRLQELTNDPELWPLIAANPGAYDSLVAWLGENGGADVQAAIAWRAHGAHGAHLSAVPPARPAVPDRSNKGLWITLSVLVFVLLSGGAGVGVWAVTKDDDSSSQDDTRTSDDDTDADHDDTDRDDDEKDTETSSDELDCDELEDLMDAADDITMYFVDLDEESMLTDAVDVLEEFDGHDNRDVAEAVETLLDYADAVEDDPDVMLTEQWSDALDAKFALDDLHLSEC